MIVKNEQAIFARALQSIQGVYDELVVVDTGSTDNSIEVAEKFGAKTLPYRWKDDFAEARSFASLHAENNYVLAWDADWILAGESKQFLLDLKARNFDSADVIYGTWINEFDQKTRAKIKAEAHFFIYSRDTMQWRYPIHEELVPRQEGYLPKVLNFPQIIVYHEKQAKPERYEQNRNLLLKVLDDPSLEGIARVRMIGLLGHGYFFEGLYSQAAQAYCDALSLPVQLHTDLRLFLLERLFLSLLVVGDLKGVRSLIKRHKQLLRSDVRGLLIQADFAASQNSNAEALRLYRLVLSHPQQKKLAWGDSIRYETYPHTMISMLESLK